jgi:hypothetical protein
VTPVLAPCVAKKDPGLRWVLRPELSVEEK